MKFFHLSDLHIGLRLMNRDLKEDQEYILRQITDLAVRERPDAVVVAGDVYDKAVPSAEAVEVFDRFIRELAEALPDTAIMLISGNHDSGPRLNCFRGILSRQHVYMVGTPPQTEEERLERVTLTDAWGPVDFYLLPFVRPSMVRRAVAGEQEGPLSYNDALHRLIGREQIDPARRAVLVSHQFYLPAGKTAADVERMDSEIRTVGNIDEVRGDFLERFDYAALGHIHKPMEVGGPFCRYCGTPLACSVSEAGQEKGVVMVELGQKGDRKVTVLPLTPLRQVRLLRGDFAQILGQACGDYVTVVLTDRGELDIPDVQDRLRHAFPKLLEIRRETQRRAKPEEGGGRPGELDPLELCCAFLGGADGEEQKLLADVIRTVQEVM